MYRERQRHTGRLSAQALPFRCSPSSAGLAAVLAVTGFLCLRSKFPFTETNWLKFCPQKEATDPTRTNLSARINSPHACHSQWLSDHPEMCLYHAISQGLGPFPALHAHRWCHNQHTEQVRSKNAEGFVCFLQIPQLTDTSPLRASLFPQPCLHQVLFLFQFV